MVVFVRSPVLAQDGHLFRDRGVVGGDHAPLAGRHVLGRIERECRADAQGTGLAAADRGSMRLARVFDEHDAMPVRDPAQFVDLSRMTVQVDRHEGLCPRRNRGLHLCRVQAVRVGLDVDEDGSRADEQRRVGGGDEGEGARDDLVAFFDPVRQHQQMERGGPRAERDGVSHAAPLRELALESLGHRSLRELAAIQYGHHRLLFLVFHLRRCDRDGLQRVQSVLMLFPARQSTMRDAA